MMVRRRLTPPPKAVCVKTQAISEQATSRPTNKTGREVFDFREKMRLFIVVIPGAADETDRKTGDFANRTIFTFIPIH